MSDTVKDDKNTDSNKIPSSVSFSANSTSLNSNSYHNFVVKKSERLASALYVLTGFMPSEEPVRTRLRVCALDLITRSANPSEISEGGAEKFEYRCSEITTILETARYAGLISEMNARLLSEEYASLATFVHTNAAKITEKRHELQRSSVVTPRGIASPIRHYSPLEKSRVFKGQEANGKNNVLENRKGIILNLFNTKDKISLKDASALIPGVSEKTIQRDLLGLVQEGILTKSGSRRWTIYQKATEFSPA
jgi:hypothetical protein